MLVLDIWFYFVGFVLFVGCLFVFLICSAANGTYILVNWQAIGSFALRYILRFDTIFFDKTFAFVRESVP